MRQSVYPQGKLYDNETIHRENTQKDDSKNYEEAQEEDTRQTNTTDKVKYILNLICSIKDLQPPMVKSKFFICPCHTIYFVYFHLKLQI